MGRSSGECPAIPVRAASRLISSPQRLGACDIVRETDNRAMLIETARTWLKLAPSALRRVALFEKWRVKQLQMRFAIDRGVPAHVLVRLNRSDNGGGAHRLGREQYQVLATSS
jgi:hypothetical protein